MANTRKSVANSKSVAAVAATPQQVAQPKVLYRVEVKMEITRIQSDERQFQETKDCDYCTVFVAAENILDIQNHSQTIIEQACSGYANRDAVKGSIISINVQEGALIIV